MYGWGRVSWTFYFFTVYVIILSGCGSGSSNGGVANPAATPSSTVQTATKVPDIPSGVSAVGGTNKATLSWSSVSGATSYNIYCSTATGVTTVTGTKIASARPDYIHRGLLPSVIYYYVVTAQNGAGESSASGQFSAATAAVDGAAYYSTYCASCHGRLETSNISDTTAPEIKSALHSWSVMNSLTLTDAQISVISAALMYNQ